MSLVLKGLHFKLGCFVRSRKVGRVDTLPPTVGVKNHRSRAWPRALHIDGLEDEKCSVSECNDGECQNDTMEQLTGAYVAGRSKT